MNYFGGLLVETTSLIVSTFVLAFFLDHRAKKREERRWAVVQDLNTKRLTRELHAFQRSLDGSIGIELDGKKVIFYESQEALDAGFARLRRQVNTSTRRDQITIKPANAVTPGRRMSDTSRRHVDRILQLGLAAPTADQDANLVELLLKVEEANHRWEDQATWIGTDPTPEAADALEALLAALENLAAALS